jgi:hypothetical protein
MGSLEAKGREVENEASRAKTSKTTNTKIGTEAPVLAL